ncbi:hypothetical protein [Haloplanus natans]|uniref:hypothetical protein n=1 Tax=Haloplanus natans TaxID=376171 RepID=UPI000677DC2D|nr:hypothetical protein [Haloplanus natans]
MPAFRTRVRWLSLLGVLAGVVHLLVPARLLATARWGYDRVLAVEFVPRPNATRRVRLLGLLMVAGSALVYRIADR